MIQGILKEKTRILVTHSIDFLHLADKIIILKQGKIMAQGHFNDLVDDPYLKEVISIHSDQINEYKSKTEDADQKAAKTESDILNQAMNDVTLEKQASIVERVISTLSRESSMLERKDSTVA